MPLLENLISQATVERLGWMLVHGFWQTTAVALLLAGILRLLRKSGANLRYVISCLALILMVVLPVLTIQFIRGAGPAAEPGPVPVVEPSGAAAPLSTAQAVAPMSPLAAPLMIRGAPIPAAALSWRERMVAALEPGLPYVVFSWLLGVFGLSAWHLGGWVQLQRIKRRMVQQVGPALRNKVDDLCARLPVHRGVALLESALVEVPTVVGWLRPAILLPACVLTSLSPDQLEAILAHELAHIRRYDYLVNLLQTVVEILGFYHPAVWWVSRRIRIERENCCDDLAVGVCGDSLQYARALTCMEEIRHSRTEWAVAATGGSLLARIARVLGRPAVDDRRFAWLPGLLTLVLITALLIPTAFVLGAAGPQQKDDSSNPAVVEDVNDAPNPPENQQGNHAEVQVQTDANDRDNAPTPEKALIQLEFTIAKVLQDGAMDRETSQQALSLLGVAAPDAAQTWTAYEVLKTYVVGRELPPETVQSLMDLLRSRGYIQIESNPRVMTADGTEANVRVGAEVPVPVPTEGKDSVSATTVEYVACGTAIRITAHLDRPDAVTLEMAVELTNVLPNPPTDQIPRIHRRAIENTLTLSTDHYFSLLMEPTQDEESKQLNEVPVLITIKPSIVESQAAQTTADNQQQENPTTPAEIRPRQVLLDARVVALDHNDLSNLDVEWGNPPVQAVGLEGTTPGNNKVPTSAWMAAVRLGCTTDQAFTDLLMAKLDLLQKNGRVDILASPRILAQDGRQAQLKVVTEEWFMMTPSTPGESSPSVRQLQRVETGTTLTATPHIGDHNDMTLEIAIEVSDSVPSARGDNLPIVTRRTSKNAVTIKNGGTVILAGLTESRTRLKDSREPGPDNSTREVVVFVTARLADSLPSDDFAEFKSAEATVHLPLPGSGKKQGKEEPGNPARSIRGDLIEILTELSQRTGAKITTDATVKPTPVVLDFDPMSVAVPAALQRILQATDYQFRIVRDNVYVVYRPMTRLYEGRDLKEALLDLSFTAGVLIIPDVNVTGRVYADIREQSVEKALEIMLAGTPYVVKRTPEHYLVANRFSLSPGPLEVCEKRVILLSHITPERVKSLIAPAFHPYVETEPANPRDPNNCDSIVTITAPPSLADRITADVRRFDTRPRQVLLDARVMAMSRRDLLNLGIEWGAPRFQTDLPSDSARGRDEKTTNDTIEKIVVGYVQGGVSTDSLYAKLYELAENHQAERLSSPQILAQNGRTCQLKLLSQDWFFITDVSQTEQLTTLFGLQKIVAGTSLFITPRVDDHNDMMLEMALEVSDVMPKSQKSDLPAVTRRLAKNVITVDDGGTVVWAGLGKNGIEQKNSAPALGDLPLLGPLFRNNGKDESGEVVIFVTAHLIRDAPSTE